MNTLVLDIFELIFDKCNMRDLFRFESVSKYCMYVVRNIKLRDIRIKPKFYNYLHIINNYKFRNLNLGNLDIKDENVKFLNACYALDIRDTFITDKSTELLSKRHKIDLYWK